MFYSILPLIATYFVLTTLHLGKSLSLLFMLFDEVDLLMKKIRLTYDYRFLIVPGIISIVLTNLILTFLAICYIYLMIKSGSVAYFFEMTAGISIGYFVIFYFGILLTSLIDRIFKLYLLKKYLKGVLNYCTHNNFNAQNQIEYEYLYKYRSLNYTLNTIILLLSKQSEIMDVTLSITSYSFFICSHIFPLMLAICIFVYVKSSEIMISFVATILLFFIGYPNIIIFAEFYERMVCILCFLSKIIN